MSQLKFCIFTAKFHSKPCSVPARPLAKYRAALCRLVVWLLFSLLLIPPTAFAAGKTTVIYPELVGPYKEVFETILQGIESTSGNEIIHQPLASDYLLSDLRQKISSNQSDGIITLGKQAYLATKQLKSEQPVVAGALSLVPNGISGISLAADPDLLFARLKLLAPDCTRVFVVYSEQNSGWLIPLAEKAAVKHSLLLRAYPAKDLREAMHHYRSLLRESKPNKDAIWLPLDRVTVNDDVVLPLLLQSAWNNNLAIISNKPAHAKRGVLFAMYPDHFGLGQELNKLLGELSANPDSSLVIPLKRLQLAVNLRTASHLGLSFTPGQSKDFTLTFPSR